MTKDVLVSIKGLQFESEGDEPVEVISVGQYYKKGNKHYILYDEIVEDESGRDEVTKNMIKISENVLEMYKKGSGTTHMVFEENRKNLTYYNTAFGQLVVGVDTTRFQVIEEEEAIGVKIRYYLEINYSHVSDCEITIKILSKGN